MRLDREVSVSGSSMGRFGTSIASVADLNGDGLRDVAVGAPLENEGRGAVYIFLGDGQRGIRSTFTQVGQPAGFLLHQMREVTLKTFVCLSLVSSN